MGVVTTAIVQVARNPSPFLKVRFSFCISIEFIAENDRLLDFFAGSGSFGDAADRHGRDATLVDVSPDAIAVMRRRFAGRDVRFVPPRAY